MLFNIFLHFRRSTASSYHSGICSSLNSGLTRRTSLRSTAASATTEAIVKLKLTAVALPVVVYATAAAAGGSW
jgi:hypothetical protein